MISFRTLLAAAIASHFASVAMAEDWVLDPALSNIAFGSIKNDSTGESHSFTQISGTVSPDGTATLQIALASVETMIDIRNERMIEHVFAAAPSATVSAQFDMSALEDLAIGAATVIEADGTVSLLGTEVDLYGPFFVMRLSEDRIMAATDGMLMLNLEDAGISAGIDKLQELAGLDSITRVSPVTMRLVFAQGG